MRGSFQTAYQVLVASTESRLADGEADLWDSHRVSSAATFGITYRGKPLVSGQRCYWKARVWDNAGKVSEWSDIASWSMGLFEPGDWTADWIGYDEQRVAAARPAPLAGAEWIMHGEDQPGEAPAGNRLYVKRFSLPEGARVVSAEALVVADDKQWLAVNGDICVHGEPGWRQVKPVAIADTLRPGENELRVRVENASQGSSGMLAKITIKLSNGETIVIVSDESWEAVKSLGRGWPARAIAAGELSDCRVVGDYGCPPWGMTVVRDLHLPPAPLLRSGFTVTEPVASATLYVTALGVCDAYLNGGRVSDEYFTPGWTDYSTRVYYRAYDVTDRVRQGENVLGAELADGWYSGYIGWGRNRDHYGTKPRVRLQLHIEHHDGSTQTVGTGEQWKAHPGPTREADFLMGETYDARAAQEGWSASSFDDSHWRPVVTGAEVTPRIEAHPGPPVVAFEEIRPKTITEPTPGAFVFDFGQNFAGVVRLKVCGARGQRVQVRFAERLNPDGTIYTTNLRGARATDVYTCKGDGVETWSPRFTFHGFQYAELTGLESPPDEETVTGLALSSETPRAGGFACSDPVLNRLAENAYWTQRANFIDVPTDCPQRDERLGWTGDAQVYLATACLQADVQAFFNKWLVDLNDAQRADGQYPTVAPLVVAGDDGGPAWADAGVICPWSIYETYGDIRLLRRCYPAMKRFVEFCRNRSTSELLPPTTYRSFGDWLSVEAETPKEVIYTAYFAHSARLLAQSARTLGYEEDAQKYHELADRVKRAFNSAYVTEEGVILGDTQCGYAMALSYDLLDGEVRQKAAGRLVRDIERRGDHLSTGFVGTKDLMLALAKADRNDVAYRLIHQDSYPSWGFSIKQGATSIWERWDGWTPDKGFQNAGMNSFSHYSFGAVYRWMVENIGGIQNGGEVYKHIVIAPSIDERLQWADVFYDSVRGKIRSRWEKTASGVSLRVTIPPNTKGELRLSDQHGAMLTIDGKPLEATLAVESAENAVGKHVVHLLPGSYSILQSAGP